VSRGDRRSGVATSGHRWPPLLALVGLITCFAYGWFVLLPGYSPGGDSPAQSLQETAGISEPAVPHGVPLPAGPTPLEPAADVAESLQPATDPCEGAMAAALGNARIEFRTASTEILPASRNVISVLAALAHVCDGEILIAGHSDDLGPEAANEALSRGRAQAVLAAFIGFGIEPDRLEARGYGSSRPVADNSTAEGRARNRRIELSFTAAHAAATPE